jgi:large subunit ribosomal protein L10
MATEKKELQVQDIADRLGRCTIAIATDYRGLAMPEMTALRRKLRAFGVEYRVIKNTLARLAAEQTGAQPLVQFLEGPTAIAFGYGEATEPAKVLIDHIRLERSILAVKGAVMGARSLASADVGILATLPSRQELIAKTAGALIAPISALQFVLSSQVRGLVTTLSARVDQLQEETAS